MVMRANRLFWPLALVILGVLFLLDNLGILKGVSIWGIFIPVLLILGGLSVLANSFRYAGRHGETTALSIPLEGSENAHLKISYGAGQFALGAGAASGQLLSGTFDGGVDHDARRGGGGLDVKLSGPSDFAGIPWWEFGGGRKWDIHLNGGVPLALDVEVGAAESKIDLTDIRVTDLKLQTGASGTDLWMPARAGQTHAKVSAGVASINIKIPSEVAARIEWEGGLSTIDVDTRRFPQSGKVYQSPNYADAANRIDLRVEMGVGSVQVR
jgi:hypothetical protein